MGRKPSKNPLCVRRLVRLTKAQDRYLVAVAKRAKMTPSTYLRLLVREKAADDGKLRMRPER